MLSLDFGQVQESSTKLMFCECIFRGFGMTGLAYVVVAARRRIKRSATKFAAATRVVAVGIFALMPTQAMIREIEDADTARSRGTARSSNKESCHRGEENPWPNSAATECTSVIYGMEASTSGRAVIISELVWQRPNAEHVGRVVGGIDAHRHHPTTLLPFRRSHV